MCQLSVTIDNMKEKKFNKQIIFSLLEKLDIIAVSLSKDPVVLFCYHNTCIQAVVALKK